MMNGAAAIGMDRRRTKSVWTKLASYEIRDVVRSRWVAAYGLFFLALTESLLRFGGGSIHALVSLVNVILLIVPMVGVVFGTMYLYGAREFIEMLLSQPVNRRQLYVGLYAGVAVPLCGAFLVGTAVPFLIHGIPDPTAFATLLGAGTLLTLIFVGFAFPIAIGNDERVRGLALALGSWLLLTLVYDGLVLFVVQAASDYPLEIPAIAMMLVNPVDLARVFLLMQFDFAALMGYTGAVFERFFGGPLGTIVSLTVLLTWAATPYYLGMRIFTRKDF